MPYASLPTPVTQELLDLNTKNNTLSLMLVFFTDQSLDLLERHLITHGIVELKINSSFRFSRKEIGIHRRNWSLADC